MRDHYRALPVVNLMTWGLMWGVVSAFLNLVLSLAVMLVLHVAEASGRLLVRVSATADPYAYVMCVVFGVCVILMSIFASGANKWQVTVGLLAAGVGAFLTGVLVYASALTYYH